MARNHLLPAIVAVVIAGSFAAGLFEPELRAQGLPEVLSNIRPRSPGAELEPRATYSKVLGAIQEKALPHTQSSLRMTYAAISGLLGSLDDPYTRFLDPDGYKGLREENTGEFDGIGAQLSNQPTKEGYIRILRPVPGGPAARAGIRKGDLIIRIDGKPVAGIPVDDAVKIIRGKAGTIVRLTVHRPGEPKPLEVPITRAPVEFEVVNYHMKGDIGYISLAQFNEIADPKVEQAYRALERQGMKGLVLDLRGNPGGLLDAAIDIGSRFIPEGKGVVIIVESGGERDVRKTIGSKYLLKVPLVVLVNHTSASASEIVSGAIKDNHAGTVVGTTTFGKGLVQTVVPLSNGSACMITTAKYLNPSGKDINRSREQRGGVEPDVTVEMTEEEFLAGKDPQLDRAIEILHQKKGAGSQGSGVRG